MDLLLDTVALRPYVFAFLALFLAAGFVDLGWRRTLLFGAIAWPVACLSELSSTRTGVPFGLYHYTGATQGQEVYIADAPLMDSLSFTFLAYAGFCVARGLLAGRRPSRAAVALVAGLCAMALDVVIDPLAVRGDRWFLGRIFYYAAGGSYFGVPLSNFAGWVLVCGGSVGLYLWAVGAEGAAERRLWPGIALYYAVLVFNLVVTAWIGEWALVGVGSALHLPIALALRAVHRSLHGGPVR